MIPGYHRFGGRHAEAASLANALTFAGAVAPHTKKPPTDGLVFGLGGGIAFAYGTLGLPGGVMPAPACTACARRTDGAFLRTAARRLGVMLEAREFDSRAAAETGLRRVIAGGVPAIVWVDAASLPQTLLPPAAAGRVPHVVVVCGVDDRGGKCWLDDRAASPIQIAVEQLAVARAAIAAHRRRVALLGSARIAADLSEAVREAAMGTAVALEERGAPAIAAWADLVADGRHPRGWVRAHPTGRRLFDALVWTHRAIEGTAGPGAGRRMYASFLDEAAELSGVKTFSACAVRYRALAERWTAFARSLFPEASRELKKAHELLALSARLYQERGGGAISEVRKLSAQLEGLAVRSAESFPLPPSEVPAFFSELRRALRALADEESAAAHALRRAAA